MQTSFRIIIFSFFVGAILFISGCSSTKQAVAKDDLWKVELYKGGCLDLCKAYSISIESTGHFNYSGKTNVKYLGDKVGQFSEQNIKELEGFVKAINWGELDPEYGHHANDSQRKELIFFSKSVEKKVIYYRLEPIVLRNLEAYIDNLINEDEF